MENATPEYFILGSDFFSLYGIDMVHSREKYLTIGNDDKKEKFALQRYKRILPVGTEEVEDKAHQQLLIRPSIGNAQDPLWDKLHMGPRPTELQEKDISDLVNNNRYTFGLLLTPIGDIGIMKSRSISQ